MSGLHKLFISKAFALLLSLLLFFAPSIWGEERTVAGEPVTGKVKAEKDFNSALKEYNRGSYEQAKEKLLALLSLEDERDPEIKAKVYLLLAACHTNLKESIKAKDCFLELKEMVDEGLIAQVPQVDGVESESMNEYREVFGEKTFFNHKEPTVVHEVIKHNVVHAPRKTFEQKEKAKKKKKFPWLIVVGSVVVIGVAAVLLLSKKEKIQDIRVPEIEWVRIPAGEFMMGDNFNEGDADELPVHKVYLDEYYISKYEINIEQYFAYCDSVGIEKPIQINFVTTSLSWQIPTNNPIHEVSWEEAKTFCSWLSQQKGENIDLPTEAQWEKAARGNYQYRYPWGNNPPTTDRAYYEQIWTYSQRFASVYAYPAGVSPYGVYNMAGNAAEWCRDWYSATYYSESPKNNPTGPAGGSYRVHRGGGYNEDENALRSANRNFHDPNLKSDKIGFRIVKKAKGK